MAHKTFYENSKEVSEEFGMFSSRRNTFTNWDLHDTKYALYLNCFFHGLNQPFSESNGRFQEHLGLMFKYPALHFLKAIKDTLTLNIRGGILHALAVPFSFIYHLVGLFTRSIVTWLSAPQETIPRKYSDYLDHAYNEEVEELIGEGMKNKNTV